MSGGDNLVTGGREGVSNLGLVLYAICDAVVPEVRIRTGRRTCGKFILIGN